MIPQRGAPLELWHTYVPDEMRAAEIDKADWAGYLKAEDAVFRDVRAEVVDKVDAAEPQRPGNRYLRRQPDLPGQFRAGLEPLLVLEPDGTADRRRRCCCMA